MLFAIVSIWVCCLKKLRVNFSRKYWWEEVAKSNFQTFTESLLPFSQTFVSGSWMTKENLFLIPPRKNKPVPYLNNYFVRTIDFSWEINPYHRRFSGWNYMFKKRMGDGLLSFNRCSMCSLYWWSIQGGNFRFSWIREDMAIYAQLMIMVLKLRSLSFSLLIWLRWATL